MLLHPSTSHSIHEIVPMQNLSSWNPTESTTPAPTPSRRSYTRHEMPSSNRKRAEPVLMGDALVGNDLLDHVTRGYSELSIRTQSTTPVSSQSGSRAYKPDTPNLSLGGVLFNETGQSPRPHHHHSSEEDLSIWGGSGGRRNSNMERSTSVGEPSNAVFHHQGMHSTQYRMDNAPLVRSQSAAPLVGPPPGMLEDPANSRPPSSLTPSWEFPRSVSAGSIDEPAVRPAAKTLMELIQEDVPPPANASILGYGTVNQEELSPQRLDRSSQDWQQHQTRSSPMMQQGKPTFVSREAPAFVPGEPAHHQQVNAYYPQQQQMQMQRHNVAQQQPQPQQHVVYSNGLQQQQQQPQRDMHGGGVRVQTVSGNQQVYMNAGPPQGYSYAPVSFPPGSQQQQQQPQQQFVSVMSMPGGGQQVSYWPPAPSTAMPNDTTSYQHHHHTMDSPVVSPMPQHYRREKSAPGRGRRPRGRVDSKGSATSVLLEEFRASKSRDWTIRRIEGHISEFCQDQNGSRFIQQRLEMGDIMEQQVVMKEVLPAIRTLRTDVFGNYVVQKLLDFGTPKMKQEIKMTLEGEMLQLSLQMYGCRVVQKAMETLDEDDLPRLLREFHHNVLNCIHDQNGNHVVQKCIEVLFTRARKASGMGDMHRCSFLNEQVDFIIDDVLVNTTSLSCHPYGCRVLQRMLEHCPEKRKTQVLDEIKLCHKTLLDDQYGNYVIQHVLQYGRDEDRDSLLHIIAENGLLRLSRQKFASNVVEKLLKYGNGNQRRGIVREMLKITEDPAMYVSQPHKRVSVVLLMVRDAYANYVVQTTLDVVPESDERRLLLKELNAHVEELRNYTFAKHIVVKLAALSERS